jgi:hypothetical protein
MTEGEAMAEETQSDKPAAKKASKKSRPRKKTADAPAPSKAKVEALATEAPVPSAPRKKTSQYVVTVDNQTGLPVKIEKLDEATGKRKELTKQEYEQSLAYAGLSTASVFGGLEGSAQASSASTDDMVQAYYQGVADYINALTSNK